MPEFGEVESPGVYVIPGIVQKFKRQISRLRNAPDEAERVKQLGFLVDYAREAEGFPDDVKKALGGTYTFIEGYSAFGGIDPPEGLDSKWVDENIKDIEDPDPEIAESFGTVSDVLAARGSFETDKTATLFGFLGDDDSLGEGATQSPGEARDPSVTLGSSGNKFQDAFLADDAEGMNASIASASNAMKVPLGEDSRYGTFKSNFDDDSDLNIKMEESQDDPELFKNLTAERAAEDEQKRREVEEARLNREFVGQVQSKGESTRSATKAVTDQNPYLPGGSEYKPVDTELSESLAMDQPDPAFVRGTEEYLERVRPKLKQAAQREFEQTAPPPISGVDSVLITLNKWVDGLFEDSQDEQDRKNAIKNNKVFTANRRKNFSADVQAQEEAQVDPIDPYKITQTTFSTYTQSPNTRI